MRIEFQVQTQPLGKARPRAGRNGFYTPAKTVAYEKIIAAAAQEAMIGKQIIDGAVRLDVACTYAMPKSWSKKKKAAMLYRWHAQKPDFDNVTKAIADGGLNGIVIKDDAQIAVASYRGVWAEHSQICVTVEEL